jgi:amino acid permease
MAERLLSREDVLGGMPARRAGTALHAIRSRTASLVARSRRAVAGYVGERSAVAREQEFLAALATGRELPRKPTVQELERYAGEWASLVPDDPALRAAIAKLLADDEAFTADRVPRLRAALGLDAGEVRQAFERAQGTPLESIYAESLPLRERLRWRTARAGERLERMPPFWTAFALTLTECVGAGILAIPVAMAGIGPLGAVIVLAVFGAINIVTVAALVEAITRTGSMRYGTAYFDRLVSDHLGRLGAGMMGAALFALNGAVLLVALIGFGSVLESTTGLPVWLWASLLFAGNLWLLRRERMDATIASALVIGAVNIVLIVALSAVALTHLRGGNFEQVNVPLLDGRPVDTDVLVLIFGVVLLAFFGHTSAANSAKVVLERDPTGRALLWGNVAALLAATVLYSLTALAFTGALERGVLEGTGGTALEPLADRVGVAADVLGSVFAVLAIGMGSVYACLGLYNQVVEWRPQRDANRRFVQGAAIPVALFALMLWLVATDRQSFSEPLGYVGTLTAPLLGGVFPMLLLVASRRRGELVPGTAPRLIGHPVTATAIGVLFLAGVVLHGALIWDQPPARVAALAVAGGMAAVAVMAWRRGAFRPRAVIELRREPERDLGHLGVTVAGAAGAAAAVELDGRAARPGSFERFSQLRRAAVVLPADAPAEVAVWLHRVSSDGHSTPVPGAVEVAGRHVGVALDATHQGGVEP